MKPKYIERKGKNNIEKIRDENYKRLISKLFFPVLSRISLR